MSEVTVSQLASDVGIPVDRLLKQLSDAGISKQSAEDIITEQEKMDLLNHLRRSHGKQETAGGPARARSRSSARPPPNCITGQWTRHGTAAHEPPRP